MNTLSRLAETDIRRIWIGLGHFVFKLYGATESLVYLLLFIELETKVYLFLIQQGQTSSTDTEKLNFL